MSDIAIMTLTNTFSIIIVDCSSDDIVKYKFSDSNEIFEATLHTGVDGDLYFNHGDESYFLDDFIRANYPDTFTGSVL